MKVQVFDFYLVAINVSSLHPSEDNGQLSFLQLGHYRDFYLITEPWQSKELSACTLEFSFNARLGDSSCVFASFDLKVLLLDLWSGHTNVVLLVLKSDVLSHAISHG